jgi:hypothetical protein
MFSLTPTRTVADACDLCGAVAADGDVMHWAMGKLWCPECHAGQRAAASMPPTAEGRRQLELWIRGAP